MTAVTKPERTALQRQMDDTTTALRERNAMVAQIRGTQWGLGIDSRIAKAVAHYCLNMGLDPVRHVEVLGGRIYLTAEFYQERGARLLREGIVVLEQPEFINVDARLDDLAAHPDEESAAWARGEIVRRARLRIEHNAPDAAKAIVIQRITVKSTGMQAIGVNWCGGGTRKKYVRGGALVDGDPIGDLEPAKTALTRAARRAWKLVADVIPDYGAQVRPVEAQASLLNGDLAPEDEVKAEPERAGHAQLLGESREIVRGTATEPPITTFVIDDPYGIDMHDGLASAPAPAAVLEAASQDAEFVIDDAEPPFTLPNWRGHPLAGKVLVDCATDDVAALYSALSEKDPIGSKDLIDRLALELDQRRDAA